MPDVSSRIHLFAELSLAVALAVVLDLFRIPLPFLLYGGSLSLEGVPILLLAFRRGARAGLLVGVAYGIVSFALKPIVVHPLQPVLDYPLAYGALGWGAGLVGGTHVSWHAGSWWRNSRLRVATGIVAANALRFLVHFISGMVFFGTYAPVGQPVWEYSLVYNSSYIIPQALLQILLVQLMLRFLITHG